MARLITCPLVLVSIWLAACGGEPSRRRPWEQDRMRNAMTKQPPNFGARGARPRPNVDPRDVLFWNRWDDESIEPRSFMRVSGFLETDALVGSNGYLDSVLRPGAELFLYNQPGREHYIHVEPDCQLHRFDFQELPLLVYENPTYITVRVATRPLAGEALEAFVRRVMGALLNYSVAWYFFPSSAPDESARFSTNRAYTIAMAGEAIGFSGATLEGGLYFTIHRSRTESPGPQQPGTHPLLNDALREAWANAHAQSP